MFQEPQECEKNNILSAASDCTPIPLFPGEQRLRPHGQVVLHLLRRPLVRGQHQHLLAREGPGKVVPVQLEEKYYEQNYGDLKFTL